MNVFQGFPEVYGSHALDRIEDNAEEEDDFRFIEEVVTGLVNDKYKTQSLHEMLEKALDKSSLSTEDKEGFLLELDTQQDNYNKVLNYAGHLIDSIKKTKNTLKVEVH